MILGHRSRVRSRRPATVIAVCAALALALSGVGAASAAKKTVVKGRITAVKIRARGYVQRRTSIMVPAQAGSPPVFRGGVAVVRLNVAVLDSHGRPVSGLEPRDFAITEEGELRPTDYVFRPSDTPVDVAVVLDLSGSMADELDAAREAANDFAVALGAQDCLLFLPFAAKPATPTWIPGGAPLPESLAFDIGGRDQTAFNDAVLVAQREIATRRADAVGAPMGVTSAASSTCNAQSVGPESTRRELIVVISDGLDSASRVDWSTVMSNALSLDAPVVAVFAGPPPRPSSSGVVSWDRLSRDRMQTLAEGTGGVYEELGRRSYRSLFEKTLTLMRATYVVTFTRSTESQSSPALWRSLSVRVAAAEEVLAPGGYYTRSSQEAQAMVSDALGRRLLSVGSIDAAIEQLEQASRLDPNSWTAPFELARAYWLRKQTSEALLAALKATTARPGSGHAVAARLAANLGRFEVAVEQAIRAQQAGENVGSLVEEIAALSPESVPADFQDRLSAPRVFLASSTADTPQSFFVARSVDAELARQASDSPMLGLVNDRSIADFMVWFDVEAFYRAGGLRGVVRLNRAEHLDQAKKLENQSKNLEPLTLERSGNLEQLNRSENLRTLSTHPELPLLAQLRRWTIKSWRLELTEAPTDEEVRTTVEPIVASLAAWLREHSG